MLVWIDKKYGMAHVHCVTVSTVGWRTNWIIHLVTSIASPSWGKGWICLAQAYFSCSGYGIEKMTLDPLCFGNIRQKKQFARLCVCLCRTVQSVSPARGEELHWVWSVLHFFHVTGKTPTFTKFTKRRWEQQISSWGGTRASATL